MSELRYFELNGSTVRVDSNEILIDGDVIKLTPKEKDVLLFLYTHRGTTLSRSRILEKVWGDSLGNDSGLTQAISRLRRILKDDPKYPTLIKTVPKTGYQLMSDSNEEVVTEIRRPNLLESYRRLSWFERLGIRVLFIIVLFAILSLFVDIQIRIEELPV